MRKPWLPLVALLALCIAAGPAILDGCVISCNARPDANTNPGGPGHCHAAASSEAASVWQATGGCNHDHIALSAETAFQVRSESSLGVLQVATIGAAAAAAPNRGSGPAPVSRSSPPGSCSPAFALPLRV